MRPARRKALITAAIAVAFAGALVLWAGTAPDAAVPQAAQNASGGVPTPTFVNPNVAASPSASATNSGTAGGSLVPLPGVGIPAGTTDITPLGPGLHRFVITFTSDTTIAQIGYVVRDQRSGKATDVQSPAVVTREISGSQARPYTAAAMQVAPDGTTGSCSISIDGKVVVHHVVHGPYEVAVCVA